LAIVVRVIDRYNCVRAINFQVKGKDCEQGVKDAIDAGYRLIDTAFVYSNEKEVGNAVRAKIKEGIIKRSEIFITSKVYAHWSTHLLFFCQLN